MDIIKQTYQLRTQLRAWASTPDWRLMARYELPPQQLPSSRQRRLSLRVGRIFRILGLDRTRYLNRPWHGGLKHALCPPHAKLLLFWAETLDQRYIHDACNGAKHLLESHPEFLPVLVTDLADFVFYSRLQWLVEYLPRLGDDAAYYDRKKCYLAWRYRHALALPLAAGLVEQKEFDTLIISELGE